MKWTEVKRKMEEEKICPDNYSFFGDGLGDCFVLTKESQGWLVYYSERGQRDRIKVFQSEEEACEYFLKETLSSSSARRKIFTPEDFERFPVWTGNDRTGYVPVLDKELSPENYANDILIKSQFTTGAINLNGYIIYEKIARKLYIFANNILIRINTQAKNFTKDNISLLFDTLECPAFKFFPLEYSSSVKLKGNIEISGIVNDDTTD